MTTRGSGGDRPYDFGAALVGLVVTALGVAFLLDALDVAELRFELLIPVVAIAVGMIAIVSSLIRSRDNESRTNDHDR